MLLILMSLCGLITCISQRKHLLFRLSCHSITKIKQESFTLSKDLGSETGGGEGEEACGGGGGHGNGGRRRKGKRREEEEDNGDGQVAKNVTECNFQ